MKKSIKICLPIILVFVILYTTCIINIITVPYKEPIVIKVLVTSNNGDMWRGTGFFIKDDLIVTAGHVVQDANVIIVQFENGKKLYAKSWLGGEPNGTDIGFIKVITPKKENIVQFSNVVVGKHIKIIGYAFGTWITTTKGEIVNVNADIPFFGISQYILTDCHTNPGNSGSPVLDNKNRVIGVLIGFYGNLSVIIPIDNLYQILQENK